MDVDQPNSLFPINHITYPWCCDMIILAYIRCILQYRISNYFCVHFFFFSRYQYIILRPYPNVNNLIIITLFYLVQSNYAMLIIALHTAANMAAALTKEWAQSRPTKKRRTTVRRISSRCRSYRLPQRFGKRFFQRFFLEKQRYTCLHGSIGYRYDIGKNMHYDLLWLSASADMVCTKSRQ